MISIIVPCYNEEKALPYFYTEFDKISREMPYESFEVLFVDDGSKDKTLDVIKEYALNDQRIKYISFSRNFGKESAIYAGFKNASGDYVCMMDADLQDPPSLLPEMYKAVTEEGYDSVATRRVTRKGEPKIRSFFARKFYKIMNKISDTDLVDGARDYRLMNRKFVDALLTLNENQRFTKGIFGWVGFKTKWIEYENVERIAGETKWSFKKLFKYALDGILSFSVMPLEISTILGFILSFLSVIGFITFGILSATAVFSSPFAYLFCFIGLMFGFLFIAVGVLGKYVSKTYLEIKNRPVYIAKESNLDIK